MKVNLKETALYKQPHLALGTWWTLALDFKLIIDGKAHNQAVFLGSVLLLYNSRSNAKKLFDAKKIEWKIKQSF